MLFGFKNMSEYIFTPMVRDITGVSDIEVVYTMHDLEQVDTGILVDIIALNAMAIGFNMNKQLQTIKLKFPESYIVMISPHQLSTFFSLKLVKNGVDALVMNIQGSTEYKRMKAAIQTRRRYYPPDLRDMIDSTTINCNQGYRFLSKNEYSLLVLTLKGMTLKEISNELDIAETTACTTRKNSFRKMGVKCLVDLVKIGIQFNLHQQEKL